MGRAFRKRKRWLHKFVRGGVAPPESPQNSGIFPFPPATIVKGPSRASRSRVYAEIIAGDVLAAGDDATITPSA